MATTTGKFVKHSTIYAIGTLSRQLVGFLMLPIYTSYMTPTDYGVVGLLAFTLALMEPLLGARLGEAIPKFYFEQKSDKGRATVINSALLVTGCISTVVFLTIYILKKPASTLLFGVDTYSVAVGLFGLQILTQAIEYYGLTFIRIQQKPYLYISVSLAKLVLQLAVNIWLIAFLKLGVMGVVISGCSCSAIFAIGLALYTVSRTGYAFDFGIAKRMLAFNLPLWFSGLAAIYIFSSNRYYIRVFSSLDQIGLYELAAKFAGVLPLLVWSSFSQFWEMERFKHYEKGRPNPTFKNVFRFVSTALIIVALGISIFSEPAIRLMSASQFYAAAISVPALTLGMLFSCLSNFSSFSLLVTEKTSIINRNSYLTVAIISALNVILIPPLGQLGAAIALMLSLALQFFIINWQAMKHYDMQIRTRPLLVMIGVASIGFFLADQIAVSKSLVTDIAIRLVVYLVFTSALLAMLLHDTSSRRYVRNLFSPLLLRLGFRPTI